MGAINSAFNQALGAVAASGVAIKHAKEADFSKMNTTEHAALVANNQAVDAEKEAAIAKLDEEQAHSDQIDAIMESWDKKEAYDKAQKDYDDKYEKGQFPSYAPVGKKLAE